MAQLTEGAFRAPWDWRALPIADEAASGRRSLEIEQSSRRKIWLTVLHQYDTYGGRMAGIPQAEDRDAERALERVVKYSREGEKSPAILPPRLIRKQLPTHPAMRDFLLEELPRAKPPDVTCVGQFHSGSMQKDSHMSIAVVIWFQEGYGLPDDEHILAQLTALDWPAYAWDWEF